MLYYFAKKAFIANFALYKISFFGLGRASEGPIKTGNRQP